MAGFFVGGSAERRLLFRVCQVGMTISQLGVLCRWRRGFLCGAPALAAAVAAPVRRTGTNPAAICYHCRAITRSIRLLFEVNKDEK